MDELLQASKHERNKVRTGYHSGHYSRGLVTRVGKIELQVPQDRQGRFSTKVSERYQRSEKAFVTALSEMYIQGVSTRKVTRITEQLCGHEVSAATSKGGWFVGAKAVHGNPYDGHTLKEALGQVERIAQEPEHAFVDMGYRGHNYEGGCEKRRRGNTARSLWKWMKRRAAIEPGIGHVKRKHRMDRCRLRGIEGDRVNAILSATGMNFGKLLKAVSRLPVSLRPVLVHLFKALERAGRFLRLGNPCPTRPDQIILLYQDQSFAL